MARHDVLAGMATVDGDKWGIGPGDEVAIAGGVRGPLTLRNIQGTAEEPVAVQAGQRVTIDAQRSWCGLLIENCRHIRIAGSAPRGIEITDFGNCGVFIRKGTEYIEVAYLEIHTPTDETAAGLRAHSEKAEVPAGWVQHGTHLHHIHVHDVGSSAFYVGKADGQDGTPLEGLHVHDCTVERIGMDAYQVRNCGNTADVHDNTAIDVGWRSIGDPNQNGAGLCLGIASGGRWHHNTVIGANLGAQLNQHAEGTELDHNVFVGSGRPGTAGGGEDGGHLRQFTGNLALIHHNTFVGGGPGIRMKVDRGRSVGAEASGLYDNLLAGVGGQVLDVGPGADHNLVLGQVEDARFVDAAAGDYRLGEGSPARGAASDGGDVGAFASGGSPPLPGPPGPPVLDVDRDAVLEVARDLERAAGDLERAVTVLALASANLRAAVGNG